MMEDCYLPSLLFLLHFADRMGAVERRLRILLDSFLEG